MAIKPKTDIYFFHIPKTAGTSLGRMLRSVYHDDDCLAKNYAKVNYSELVRRDRAEINGCKCFTDHFGTALYAALDREIPTVTILRDPFERTVSCIKFSQKVLRNNANRLQGNYLLSHFTGWLNASPSLFLWVCDHFNLNLRNYRKEADAKDFTKVFLRDFPDIFLRDTQTRYLGIDVDLTHIAENRDLEFFDVLLHKMQGETTMEATLERAKRRLDSMAVVGTVERFAESTELIFEKLGVPVPDKLREENVSAGHKVGTRYRDTSIATPRFVKWVDSFTQYDRQLYEYANTLLDRQLANRQGSVR